MSSYDLAFSMDKSNLNHIISSLYQRPGLKQRLFSGSEQINLLGKNVTATWAVQKAPFVDLNIPSAQQWRQAIKADGKTTPRPTQNAFLINLSRLLVSRTTVNTGERQDTTIPVQVICTAGIAYKRMHLDPQAAIVDLSGASELDQSLYKVLIVPKILQMADSMLSGQHLPDLRFHGVKFDTYAISIGDDRLVVVSNLPGKPTPTAPPPATMPQASFYILLSREALQQIANDGVRDLVGKSASTSGSEKSGGFSADYSLRLRVDSASASVSADPAIVHTSLGLSASASAGVDFLSGIIHGLEEAGKTVVHGLEEAGKEIAHAFSSY